MTCVCLIEGCFLQGADRVHMLSVPNVLIQFPSMALFWKILRAERAVEQLLEKTKAHHTFLFPKALCLNSGWLMTQLAGRLPKASTEQRLSAEAGGAGASWR